MSVNCEPAARGPSTSKSDCWYATIGLPNTGTVEDSLIDKRRLPLVPLARWLESAPAWKFPELPDQEL